jgi:hypothetical protein
MVGLSTSTAEPVSVVVAAARELMAAPEPRDVEPLKRKRAPRARLISGQDESALAWFFGQGLSIYEKSTFGPIVEKIAMDGYASAECGKCGGSGILEDGGFRLESKCRGCGGSRLQPRKAGEPQQWCLTCGGLGREMPYEVECEHGGWCPTCRGTGGSSVERRAIRRPRCSWCRPEPYVFFTDERTGGTTRAPLITAWVPRHACPNCLSTGDEPITAKPVLVPDEGGGALGADEALTRFAITSRRAGSVKDVSPALHAALASFYGDVGSRWALTQFGRLFALYHLTPAGKKLARMGIETAEKGKKKKGKNAAKTQRLIEAALARGKRNEADRLARELKRQQAVAGAAGDAEPQHEPLTAQERIGIQAVLQQSQPKDDRRKLLEQAREQAQELYARAAGAWNEVATPAGALSASKRLERRLKDLGHSSVAKLIRAERGAL